MRVCSSGSLKGLLRSHHSSWAACCLVLGLPPHSIGLLEPLWAAGQHSEPATPSHSQTCLTLAIGEQNFKNYALEIGPHHPRPQLARSPNPLIANHIQFWRRSMQYCITSSKLLCPHPAIFVLLMIGEFQNMHAFLI